MLLIAAGLNHKTAPVDLRERASIPESQLPSNLRKIVSDEAIDEVVLLATCNRAEIFAVFPDDAISNPQNIVIEHLAKSAGAKINEFTGHTYYYTGERAVEHLMRVTASLDSMMLGEYQILGQVRKAYEYATQASTAGPHLNSVFQTALSVGKKIRNATTIGQGAFSVGAAAVELASHIFGESLAGKTVLVLGAGEMGELTARHLHAHGAPTVIVTNRTFDHAVDLAKKIGSSASALRYDDLEQALLRSDVMICSTSAPHFVVTKSMIQTAMRARRNRPLFIVDIAVPRDVEQSVGDLENVYLYNIDDLSQVVARDQAKRQIEAEKAELIIAEALDKYRSSRLSSEVGSLISAVSERFSALMESEITVIRSQQTDLSDHELKNIQVTIRSITGRLSHDVIMTIKSCATDGSLESQAQLEAIRAVFASHSVMNHDSVTEHSTVEIYEAKLARLRSKALAAKH